MTHRYIDPPAGWAFGFPRRFDGDEAQINIWLLAHGYPERWINLWPGGVPCRIIESPKPVESWERNG